MYIFSFGNGISYDCNCTLINVDKPAAIDEFISALQRFMETSMVGEFEIRLQMVESFHLEMMTTGKLVPWDFNTHWVIVTVSRLYRYW